MGAIVSSTVEVERRPADTFRVGAASVCARKALAQVLASCWHDEQWWNGAEGVVGGERGRGSAVGRGKRW